MNGGDTLTVNDSGWSAPPTIHVTELYYNL